ncbi:MAG: hypothetical protein LUO89_11780 [Methanothrix sp.]|nr:hypothetical protein [Methanothrix sp.]
MVFNPMHCVPSFIAAFLILILFFKFSKRNHIALSITMVFLGILGLIGYISAGRIRFFPLDLFTFHAWIGLMTLLLSIYLLVNGKFFHKKHCYLGRIISALAAIALLTGLMLFFGLTLK